MDLDRILSDKDYYMPDELEEDSKANLLLLVGHIIWFRLDAKDTIEDWSPTNPCSPPASDIEYAVEVESKWRPALVYDVYWPGAFLYYHSCSISITLLHRCDIRCRTTSHSRMLHDSWLMPLSSDCNESAEDAHCPGIRPLQVDGDWNESGWSVHLAAVHREPCHFRIRQHLTEPPSSGSPHLSSRELGRLHNFVNRDRDVDGDTKPRGVIGDSDTTSSSLRKRWAREHELDIAEHARRRPPTPPLRWTGASIWDDHTYYLQVRLWNTYTAEEDMRSLSSCLTADIARVRVLINDLFHTIADSVEEASSSTRSVRPDALCLQSSTQAQWALLWFCQQSAFIEAMDKAAWSSLAQCSTALVISCQSHLFRQIEFTMRSDGSMDAHNSSRAETLKQLCIGRLDLPLLVETVHIHVTQMECQDVEG